jgi:hypothetical protein
VKVGGTCSYHSAHFTEIVNPKFKPGKPLNFLHIVEYLNSSSDWLLSDDLASIPDKSKKLFFFPENTDRFETPSIVSIRSWSWEFGSHIYTHHGVLLN